MKLYGLLMKNNKGNKSVCRKLIKEGHVFINDVQCFNPNQEVEIDDFVNLDQEVINSEPYTYILVNKPKGYICAHHDKIHACLTDIIPFPTFQYVGRLDKNTTGLVILTNDNYFRKRMTLPQYHVPKTYLFETRDPVTTEQIKILQNGVIIDQDVLCLPAIIEMKSERLGKITISEGKYHQIKKMFLSVNNEIRQLRRLSIGPVHLEASLKEGAYRRLSYEEVNAIMRYTYDKDKEYYEVNEKDDKHE